MLSSMSLHSSVRRTAGHFHRGHHFPYSPVHSTHPAWPELLNSWFIVHLKKLNRLNFYITVNSSKFPVQYKKKKKESFKVQNKSIHFKYINRQCQKNQTFRLQVQSSPRPSVVPPAQCQAFPIPGKPVFLLGFLLILSFGPSV